ncbi:hypothetical protein ACWC9H_35370 [Streptomyces sp. NPDC001251]
MSATTGPMLAVGAITVANQSIFHDEPVDWRVPIAAGFAAMGFSLFERSMPDLARVLAWGTVAAVLLTRTNPKVPSPVESFLDWWNKGGK